MLISWNLGKKLINKLEHPAIKFFPQPLRSVGVDRRVNEVELLFEDAVRGLKSQSSGYYLNKFVRSHLGVLDHLEETPPNQSSTENVLNRVNVFNEKLKRNRVYCIFYKGVVFIV